jgi:hypothetical protein
MSSLVKAPRYIINELIVYTEYSATAAEAHVSWVAAQRLAKEGRSPFVLVPSAPLLRPRLRCTIGR